MKNCFNHSRRIVVGIALILGVLFSVLATERHFALNETLGRMEHDYVSMQEAYANSDQAAFEQYQSYLMTDADQAENTQTARNVYAGVAFILIVSGGGILIRDCRRK